MRNAKEDQLITTYRPNVNQCHNTNKNKLPRMCILVHTALLLSCLSSFIEDLHLKLKKEQKRNKNMRFQKPQRIEVFLKSLFRAAKVGGKHTKQMNQKKTHNYHHSTMKKVRKHISFPHVFVIKRGRNQMNLQEKVIILESLVN